MVTGARYGRAPQPTSSSNTVAPSLPASARTPDNVTSGAVLSVNVAAQNVCDELVQKGSVTKIQQLNSYFDSSQSVPPEYDGKLIAKTGAILGRPLSADEKRHARGIFVKHVRALRAG